jgi:hypothetical protein
MMPVAGGAGAGEVVVSCEVLSAAGTGQYGCDPLGPVLLEVLPDLVDLSRLELHPA